MRQQPHHPEGLGAKQVIPGDARAGRRFGSLETGAGRRVDGPGTGAGRRNGGPETGAGGGPEWEGTGVPGGNCSERSDDEQTRVGSKPQNKKTLKNVGVRGKKRKSVAAGSKSGEIFCQDTGCGVSVPRADDEKGKFIIKGAGRFVIRVQNKVIHE